MILKETLSKVQKSKAFKEWAKKNPDQAANLLKGWIEER